MSRTELQHSELNTKFSDLIEVRKNIADLQAQLKTLKEDEDSLTEECVAIMQDLGLTKAGTSEVTMSLSYELLPIVDAEHWDELREWVIDHEYQAILPRRINAASWRELRSAGIEVPYVREFNNLKVSFRKT